MLRFFSANSSSDRVATSSMSAFILESEPSLPILAISSSLALMAALVNSSWAINSFAVLCLTVAFCSSKNCCCCFARKN